MSARRANEEKPKAMPEEAPMDGLTAAEPTAAESKASEPKAMPETKPKAEPSAIAETKATEPTVEPSAIAETKAAEPAAESKTAEPKTTEPNILLRILRYERTQLLLVSVIAVLLSLLVISLIIIATGKNPLRAFHSLLQGSGLMPKPRYAGGKSMLADFLSMLDAMTPLLFAALAVTVALKAGLFNVGVSGQMLFAGFITTVVIGYSSLGFMLAKPLVLLLGVLFGALMGALVGVLKAKFNINEVVSTIMLNYIVSYVVSFFIKNYYVDPISRQSHTVSADARLTLMNVQIGDTITRIPLGFIFAIVVAILLYLLLKKTKLGFEIRAAGVNRKASQYLGIKANRIIIIAMALSGACAGLAGVTFYLGYHDTITPEVLSSTGFDSIAVALLANANPLACIFSSLMITILTFGSTYMTSAAGVNPHIASLMVGVVLLFCACSGVFSYLINRRKHRESSTKEGRGS